MPKPSKIYRVYCFDAALQIVTGELIEASSDKQAIARAEAIGHCDKCEIWDGSRLVAQLDGVRRQA
jgi:hypothetical protein